MSDHNHICDAPNCQNKGNYPAPRTRNPAKRNKSYYYWFCLTHVRDYNKKWNYYDGLSERQIELDRQYDALGRRPLHPREASLTPYHTLLHESTDLYPTKHSDFYAFRWNPPKPSNPQNDHHPYSGEEIQAVKELNLSLPLCEESLRARYYQLVKQLHPDARQNDNDSLAQHQDHQLRRINKAYSLLRERFSRERLAESVFSSSN